MLTTILSVLFVLLILVFFHELGHFLAARSVGVRVERFYLGFNLFGLGIKKKIGDTEYGLGLFPLGGYVKLAGMLDESMDSKITGEPWEFQSKKSWEKIWVMSAGVLGNMLLAVVLFTGITLNRGLAESDPSAVIGSIVPDFPAVEAGFQEGDRIVAIDGVPVDSWEGLTALIHTRPDAELVIETMRDGEMIQRTVTARSTQTLVDNDIKTVGMIGIGPKIVTRPAGFGEAVAAGFTLSGRWLILTYRSLAMIITGKASFKEIGGPIMIAQLAGESAKMGLTALLGLMAIISVNFAFINILPIPAMDGGQIFVVLLEAVLRRPLSLRARMAIQQAGMLILLTLMVAVIYNDIHRLMQ